MLQFRVSFYVYSLDIQLGLVCFVLMFAVILVKDACLFSSCRFSFSLVMRLLSSPVVGASVII